MGGKCERSSWLACISAEFVRESVKLVESSGKVLSIAWNRMEHQKTRAIFLAALACDKTSKANGEELLSNFAGFLSPLVKRGTNSIVGPILLFTRSSIVVFDQFHSAFQEISRVSLCHSIPPKGFPLSVLPVLRSRSLPAPSQHRI